MSIDYSTLFGTSSSSSSSSNIFNSIDFNQFSTLRNGSMYKLAKAYYAKDTSAAGESTTNNTNKTSSTTTKSEEVDSTGYSQMAGYAGKLDSAVSSLADSKLYSNEAGTADTSKITSAVKNFADEYNKVLDQSEKVNSKDVKSEVNSMKSMTDTMSKVLNKIGVSVGEDGKLSVDEDKLKKADSNLVKSLFAEPYSYGQQVANDAQDITKAVASSTATYNNDATTSSVISSLFNGYV